MENRVVLPKPVRLPIFVGFWSTELVDSFDIINNTEDETGKRLTTIQPYVSRSMGIEPWGSPYKIATGYLVGKILLG